MFIKKLNRIQVRPAKRWLVSSSIAFDVVNKVAKLGVFVKVGAMWAPERRLVAEGASVELGAVSRVARVVVRGQATFKQAGQSAINRYCGLLTVQLPDTYLCISGRRRTCQQHPQQSLNSPSSGKAPRRRPSNRIGSFYFKQLFSRVLTQT